MTAYQNRWNSMIKDLLIEINASENLRKNIVDTLHNSKRTQIFENHIINALKIGVSIIKGSINSASINAKPEWVLT